MCACLQRSKCEMTVMQFRHLESPFSYLTPLSSGPPTLRCALVTILCNCVFSHWFKPVSSLDPFSVFPVSLPMAVKQDFCLPAPLTSPSCPPQELSEPREAGGWGMII